MNKRLLLIILLSFLSVSIYSDNNTQVGRSINLYIIRSIGEIRNYGKNISISSNSDIYFMGTTSSYSNGHGSYGYSYTQINGGVIIAKKGDAFYSKNDVSSNSSDINSTPINSISYTDNGKKTVLKTGAGNFTVSARVILVDNPLNYLFFGTLPSGYGIIRGESKSIQYYNWTSGRTRGSETLSSPNNMYYVGFDNKSTNDFFILSRYNSVSNISKVTQSSTSGSTSSTSSSTSYNFSSPKHILDNSAPVTTLKSHSLSSSQLNGTSWIKSSSYTLEVSSVSDLVGVDTYYWQIYSSGRWLDPISNGLFLTLGAGAHRVRFYISDKLGNSTTKYDYTIKLDNKKPTGSLIPSLPNGWQRTDSFSTTVTLSDTSGIADSYWKINNVIQYPKSRTLNITNEGNYAVSFHASDNAGNGMATITSGNVKLDMTNPTSPILSDSVSFSESGDGNLNALFSWDASTDVGGSGIAGYKINGGEHLQTSRSTTVTVSGDSYTIKVEAEDVAVNRSLASRKVIPIPKKLTIDRITKSSSISTSNLPVYSNRIKFNKAVLEHNKDAPTTVSYDLIRTIESHSSVVFTSIKFEELVTGSDKSYFYTDVITDSEKLFKHTNVVYSIKTKFNTVTLETAIAEQQSVSLANIAPTTNAKLVIDDNVLADYISGSWSNKFPKIVLSEDRSTIPYDVENDSVIYSFEFMKPDTIFSDSQPLVSNGVAQNLTQDRVDGFNFDDQGTYSFKVKGQDSYGGIKSKELTFNYDNISPIVMDYKVLGKTRKWYTNGENLSEVTEANPTRDSSVALRAIVYDVNSIKSGLNNFLVEVYDSSNNLIYTYVKSKNEVILEEIVNSSKFLGIYDAELDVDLDRYILSIPNIEVSSHVNTEVTEKIRVRLTVFDNAGNDSVILNNDNQLVYSDVTFTYDNRPPVLTYYHASDVFPFNETGIKFQWNWGEDNIVVNRKYTDPVTGMIIWKNYLTPNGSQGKELIINTPGYNVIINESIQILDLAGNITNQDMVGYSRANTGTLSNPTFGYTKIDSSINRWIEYSLSFTDREAKNGSRLLREVNSNNNPIDNTEVNLIGNKYRVVNINGHERVNFRTYASNELNQENSSITESIIYPNYEPELGVISSNNYLRVNDTFSWNPAFDANGDAVNYSLSILKQDSTDLPLILDSQDFSDGIVELEDLEPNSTYGWTLSVNETDELYNAELIGSDNIYDSSTTDDRLNSSKKSLFYIDNTLPLIFGINNPETGHFTGNTTLEFSISDIESRVDNIKNSGLSMATVTVNNDSGENVKRQIFKVDNTNIYNYSEELTTWNLSEGVNSVDIEVSDNAGNIAVESMDILIDLTKPVVTNSSLLESHISDSTTYYTDTNSVFITLTAQDDFSGISHIEYSFVDDIKSLVNTVWQMKNIGEFTPITGNTTNYDIGTNINYVGDNGIKKYLVLRVYDFAGNYSDISSAKTILKDTTYPVLVSQEMNIFTINNSNNYLSNFTDLNLIDINYSDLESGINSIKLYLNDGIDTTLFMDSNDSSVISEELVDGVTYTVISAATNNAGKEVVTTHTSFIYDKTAPTNIVLNYDDSRPFIQGENIKLYVGATDSHSPIVKSELSIGDSTDTVAISKIITGNTDGKIELNNGWRKDLTGKYTNIYNFDLPVDLETGKYNLVLTVVNGSGIETTITKVMQVDNNQEVLTVVTPEKYTALNNSIMFNWKLHSPDDIAINTVRYKINNLFNDWTSGVLLDNSVLIEDILLLEGVEYKIEVIIDYTDTGTGMVESISSLSDSFYLDMTPVDRSNENISDIWPVYSESEKLFAQWNIFDNISGISEILFNIEKLQRVDVVYNDITVTENKFVSISDGWIGVDGVNNVGSHIFNDLDLDTGDRVRITRRVINGAGLTVENQSGVIIIDDTPPVSPTVISNTKYLNPILIDSGIEDVLPTAHWRFSQGDLESDTKYNWIFTKDLSNLDDSAILWNVGLSNKQAEVNRSNFTFSSSLHGETWYFVVKAENSVGKSSYGISEGITFDNTAPEVTRVKLVEEVQGVATETFYITDYENLQLLIEANDDVSNSSLSYEGDYGIFNNDVFESKSKLGDIITSSNSSVNILTVNNLQDVDGIVFFEGSVHDGVGLQGQGYSLGAVIDIDEPEVSDLVGYVNNGILNYTWSGTPGSSSIVNYEYKLVKDGYDLTGWVSLASVIPVLSIDTKNNSLYSDGRYTIIVKAVSDSSLEGISTISPTLIVDNTLPTIDNLIANSFASNLLRFSATSSDGINGSGIKEYQYRLGTFSNPVLLTGGWLPINSESTNMMNEIDLYNLGSAYKGVMDGEKLYLGLMVKDRSGNWSNINSSNSVTIDKTPGNVTYLEIPRYSRFTSSFEEITFTVEDYDSGVESVDFNLYETDNGVESFITKKNILVNGLEYSTTQTLDFGSTVFENDKNYILKAIVYNKTLDPSLEVESLDIVIIDTVPPELIFDLYDSEIVVNESSLIDRYPVHYSLSEIGNVKFTLTKNDKTFIINNIDAHKPGADFVYGFHYYHNTEQDAYGDYLISTTVIDRAGNENIYNLKEIQHIRFNMPPDITIYSMYTTPGKLYYFNSDNGAVDGSSKAEIFDHDGDYPLTYSWKISSNGLNDNIFTINGINPSHRFYQDKDNYKTPRSVYLLTLTVTDSNGKSTVMDYSGNSRDIETYIEPLMMIVRNTTYGELYVDEYWSIYTDDDSHVLVGDVTVGDGLTLTVLPETVIECDSENELIINGNLVFQDEGNFPSIFRSTVFFKDYWRGIRVNDTGTAILNNVELSNALKGVTSMDGSTVTIINSLITDNVIGIHAIDSSPVITNTIISNNVAYGIKEDGVVNIVIPTGIGKSTFKNNTVDYYETGPTGTDAMLQDLEQGDNY